MRAAEGVNFSGAVFPLAADDPPSGGLKDPTRVLITSLPKGSWSERIDNFLTIPRSMWVLPVMGDMSNGQFATLGFVDDRGSGRVRSWAHLSRSWGNKPVFLSNSVAARI